MSTGPLIAIADPAILTSIDISGLVALLPVEEQNRFALFKVPGPARQFLLGRLLTRWLARRWLGDPEEPGNIRVDENGRPAFVDLPLNFSISHTNELVGVAIMAVNGGAIGRDIERLESQQVVAETADTVLTASERDDLRCHGDDLDRFTRYWVAKEAALKLHGTGFLIDPATVAVKLMPRYADVSIPESSEWAGKHIRVQLDRLKTGHHIGLAYSDTNMPAPDAVPVIVCQSVGASAPQGIAFKAYDDEPLFHKAIP